MESSMATGCASSARHCRNDQLSKVAQRGHCRSSAVGAGSRLDHWEFLRNGLRSAGDVAVGISELGRLGRLLALDSLLPAPLLVLPCLSSR